MQSESARLLQALRQSPEPADWSRACRAWRSCSPEEFSSICLALLGPEASRPTPWSDQLEELLFTRWPELSSGPSREAVRALLLSSSRARRSHLSSDHSSGLSCVELDDASLVMRRLPGSSREGAGGLWMSITPVTQALYQAVTGSQPSWFHGSRHPVESVSWLDAVRFCNALSVRAGLEPVYTLGGALPEAVIWKREARGFRLPLDWEWERAAQAGTEALYAGGDSLPGLGWYEGNSQGCTQAVGRMSPNGWGLFDLSGLVYEWCWDDPSSSDRHPQSSGVRSLRGGCWNDPEHRAQVGARIRGRREFVVGDRRSNMIGLRVALGSWA